MHSNDQQRLLLGDALERIVANPSANHLWLHLMQLIRGITDAGLLTEVVHALTTMVPDDGLVGFYRATVLDLSTGDPVFLPQACACLQTIAPPDLDRYAAFYDVAWQRVLLYANNRTEYIRRLKEVGLPQLSLLIGKQLARYLPAAPAQACAEPRLRRVALVAPQLATPLHPPTQMALDQARTLIQQGIEVRLFSCQEAMAPDLRHLLGSGTDTPQLHADLQAWMDSAGGPVSLYVADHRVSLRRRWLDMLGQIDAYAPDLVLFVGLHSGLVSALYRRYPVLGMSINSIAPMVPADAWLTAQKVLADTVSRPWHEEFPASLACYHPFRVRRKTAIPALTRSSLGVDDDAVLCITMGTHLRIKIGGEWAQRMVAAMQRHPKLVWLLVGGDGDLPPALAELPPARLRLQAYTPQAAQWLAASDIYLHPPIMGGGFSVAEAMAQGKPVLALADADGGDKAGDEAAANLDDYFTCLDALAADPALRHASGERMRARFDGALDLAASGPSLLAACRQAMQRYRQRIKPADA
ncbi:glycosyltransferase [Duganella hordei]|uniref:glycosyltransferase n=1 Tax=Duganella hordei TaxID=2865934 RepID=UPI0030E9C74F